MKSYTDLEQSKKLSEILPLASADMWWLYVTAQGKRIAMMCEEPDPHYLARMEGYGIKDAAVRCWSLAALLDALRIFTTPTAFSAKVSVPSLSKTENGYKLTYTGDYTSMVINGLDIKAPIESVADNPIDACYELILKLNKLKML